MVDDLKGTLVMANDSGWLSRKEAAAYLRRLGLPIEHTTLANLATKRQQRGPTYYRFGSSCALYKVEDLDAWRILRLIKVER